MRISDRFLKKARKCALNDVDGRYFHWYGKMYYASFGYDWLLDINFFSVSLVTSEDEREKYFALKEVYNERLD